jgi:hypothetical protein
MAKHSSIVGGSNAGRLVNCPGSHQAILALPPQLDDLPNEYAAEGTAMHEVMALQMGDRKEDIERGLPLGETFVDRVLTREHVDTMIQPALDALDELEELYGGGFHVAGIEERVKFPRIPGAFGTCDLILRSNTHVMLIDWKFGSGVGVRAEYRDDDGSWVNPQLLYYLAAALHSKPGLFSKKKIVVAIIQPRSETPLTHTIVTRTEVKYFTDDVEEAVKLAIGRDPPRMRGEWCRFAPCKTHCPLWTGPLVELRALMPVKDGEVPPDRYGQYLAHAKALVDSAVMFKATIDEQMLLHLQQGGKIPGWRLKHKTKQRQWVGEETVVPALRALGFTDAEIYQRKLATFQQADATAKRRKVEIPENLRVAPPSTEVTLATEGDPAPVVEPHKLIDQFRASLQELQKQGARPQITAAKE